MIDSIFHLFLIFFSIFLPLAVIIYARFVAPHKLCVRTRVLLGSIIVFLVSVISLAIPISLKLAKDPVAYEQYNMGTWLIVMYGVMTFVFVCLICLLFRDLGWLIGKIVYYFKNRKKDPESIKPEEEYAVVSRREFLKRTSTLATLGCAAVLTPASIWYAKDCLKIREFDIRLANFPSALDGLRIAHLSDIHVGNTILEEDVAQMVEKTNALNADLIVITGDLVDGLPENIGSWVEPMRNFKAKYGVWFVTGNHDHLWNAREWCNILEGLGIHVLDNMHEIIDIAGTKIAIAGAIDAFGDRKNRRWKSDPEKALSGEATPKTWTVLI